MWGEVGKVCYYYFEDNEIEAKALGFCLTEPQLVAPTVSESCTTVLHTTLTALSRFSH